MLRKGAFFISGKPGKAGQEMAGSPVIKKRIPGSLRGAIMEGDRSLDSAKMHFIPSDRGDAGGGGSGAVPGMGRGAEHPFRRLTVRIFG